MIGASAFSSTFTAFWSAATPACEHFVRQLNLRHYVRHLPPMTTAVKGNRPYIAEYAFCLFIERRWPRDASASARSQEAAARRGAAQRLRAFTGREGKVDENLDRDQKNEVRMIAKRLDNFFNESGVYVPRPVFRGCGFLDKSEADILKNQTLYEIKTVDRPFRSADIRQLLMYSALNYLFPLGEIKNIALYNPRLGIYFDMPLEDVVREVSGRTPLSLFDEIFETISDGSISR